MNVSKVNLGKAGSLIKISGENSKNGKAKPNIIFILDVSYSMSSYLGDISTSFRECLKELEYTNEIISVITFSNNTNLYKETVNSLHTFRPEGSTYMEGVSKLLKKVLDPHRSNLVLVISDGELHDPHDTKREFMKLSEFTHKFELTVNCIRIGQDADTTALAYVTSLSNNIDNKMVDVGHSKLIKNNMFKLLNVSSSKVTLDKPHEWISTNKNIQSFSGKNGLFVCNGNPGSVYIDNLEYTLVDEPFEDFSQISNFIDTVEQKIKIMNISDMNNDNPYVQWIEDLDSFLSSRFTTVKSFLIKDRCQNLIKNAKMKYKQKLQHLRELSNKDLVSKLNSQQKADWLRNTSQSKGARGLAKRTFKNDIAEEDSIHKSIKTLSRLSLQNSESRVSFYSRANSYESTVETSGEIASSLESLTIPEILQCVGLVGVPFNAPIKDYVDPWKFRVNKVFCGESLLLSECDLWTYLQSSQDTFMECPGWPGEQITGVVPLFPHYLSYDIINLSKLHASVSMRQMVAPIPDDIFAVQAAVLWNLVSLGVMNGCQRDTFCHVVEMSKKLDTMYKFKFKNLELKRDSLTGQNDVSNVLKPAYAFILYQDTMSTEIQYNVLRTLYYFQSYHRFKRMDDKPKYLHQILKIDRSRVKVEPLFKPELMWHSPQYEGTWEIPEMAPKLAFYRGIGKLSGFTSPFNVDTNKFVLTACIQGLLCKDSKDRLNYPECSTTEECENFVNTIVSNEYNKIYEDMVKNKKEQERKITLEGHINKMVSAGSLDKFINILCKTLENSSSDGFNTLMDKLLESNNRTDYLKIGILLCGTNLVTDDVVWNKGNVSCMTSWKKFANRFRKVGFSKIWKKIHEKRMNGRTHLYREKHPNRHGHSNEFPSYFALGFKDMNEFKEMVAEEEYNNYFTEHCIKKGCCKHSGLK